MIEYDQNEEIRAIILAKVPQPLKSLVEGGVAIKKDCCWRHGHKGQPYKAFPEHYSG